MSSISILISILIILIILIIFISFLNFTKLNTNFTKLNTNFTKLNTNNQINNQNNQIKLSFLNTNLLINNQYLSKEDTFNFLSRDSDNYIHNFNQSDLIARKSSSIEDYIITISNSAISFTDKEKKYLDKISLIANNNIIKNNNFPFSQKLANIKFIFAKTNNHIYENGFPHTRENIIFLATQFFNNPESKAIKTLIHEKVHLFQRFYPNDTHNYLEQLGYQYQYELSAAQKQLTRSNPDINNSVWLDPNGNEMLPFFKNKNPKSIMDLIVSENDQHPYEAMAYSIEDY